MFPIGYAEIAFANAISRVMRPLYEPESPDAAKQRTAAATRAAKALVEIQAMMKARQAPPAQIDMEPSND